MIYTIGLIVLFGSVGYPTILWFAMKGFWYVNRITMVKLYEQCIEKNTKESLELSEEVKDYLAEFYPGQQLNK
jgi:hypothetical protein